MPGALEDDAQHQAAEPRVVGCGCILPGAGVLLLALAMALVVVVAWREGFGLSLWWLLVLALLAAIALLFGRFRTPR